MTPRRRNIRGPRRGGFALLLVLVVLAIAATVLAGLSRQSAATALEASEAADRLQAKWAAQSTADHLLARAETILAARTARKDRHVRTAWLDLQLGGLTVTVAVADEQAKANINHLAQQFGPVDLAATIRRLEGTASRLPILLGPTDLPELAISRVARRYRSYDQIFLFDHPDQLLQADRRRIQAGSGITCWSNGKLHVHRAADHAIRLGLVDVLDRAQIEQLLRGRRESPAASLTELLEGLDLGQDAPLLRARLRRRLTADSRAHSLWLQITGDPTRRTEFHVRRQADGANDAIYRRLTWQN
jgi:hypothetical protein